jgi:hypothetical protein
MVYPNWWGSPDHDSNNMVELFRKKKKKFEMDKLANFTQVNTTQSKEKIRSIKLRKETYGYQLKNDVVRRKEVRSRSPAAESKIKSDVIYDKYMHKNRERDRYLNRNSDLNMNDERTRKVKADYAICYDKNFKPESIQEKVKNGEKQYKEESDGMDYIMNKKGPSIVNNNSSNAFKSKRQMHPNSNSNNQISDEVENSEDPGQYNYNRGNRSGQYPGGSDDYTNYDNKLGIKKSSHETNEVQDNIKKNKEIDENLNTFGKTDNRVFNKNADINLSNDKRYFPENEPRVQVNPNTSYGLGSVNPQTIPHNTSTGSNNFFVSDNDIDNVLNNPNNQYGKYSHSQRNMSEIQDNFYNSERKEQSIIDTRRNEFNDIKKPEGIPTRSARKDQYAPERKNEIQDIKHSEAIGRSPDILNNNSDVLGKSPDGLGKSSDVLGRSDRKTNTIIGYKNEMIELLEKSKPSNQDEEEKKRLRLIDYFGDGEIYKKLDTKSISSKEQISVYTADFNRNSSELNKEVSFKNDTTERLSSYTPTERNKGNLY